MEHKNFTVTDFNVLDDTAGICEFLASIFATVDDGLDLVEPSAFREVIATGRMPKFVPNHDWSTEKKLGKVLSWSEVPRGLLIKAQFNLEKQIARDVYSDFKFAPEQEEFSFSFDIAENGFTIVDGVRHITNIKTVYDVGPVGIGMNRQTQLLNVKAPDYRLLQLLGDSHAELSLEDHSQMVLAAIEGIYQRFMRKAALQAKEGRTFSAANITRLLEHADSADALGTGIRSLIEGAVKESGKSTINIALQRELSRFIGV